MEKTRELYETDNTVQLTAERMNSNSSRHTWTNCPPGCALSLQAARQHRKKGAKKAGRHLQTDLDLYRSTFQ